MKKYTGIIIFVVLLILFQFLSGIFHRFAEKQLQSYIQNKLPSGSLLSNVRWNILSRFNAQDIRINSGGFILVAKEIRINYTLFALLHKHIRSITIISPKIKIKSYKGGGEKRKKGINYPAISVDNINIVHGIFQKNGMRMNITASGSIKLVSQKLRVDIVQGGCIYKNTIFSGIKGKVVENKSGIKITNTSIRMKNGNINIITGLVSAKGSKLRVKYQGDLRDFKRLIPDYGLTGKIKTDIMLQSIGKNYKIKAQGKGKDISIQNYRLGDFTFGIKKDIENNMRFSFEKKDIKVKGRKDSTELFADIIMQDLSLLSLNKYFPTTSMTGDLQIHSLKNFHNTSFSGKLENNGIKIDDIHGNIIKNKHQWSSNGIYIRSGTGEIWANGTLNRNISVDVKNFPLKNAGFIKKIPFSGNLTGSVSLKNKKIIGDFEIKDIKYKGIMCDYAGGNINITNGKGNIDIAFVNPLIENIQFRTGYLHTTIKNGLAFNGEMKGNNLNLKIDGIGNKIKKGYKLKLKHLRFIKENDSLSLSSPFNGIVSSHGLKIESGALKMGDGEILLSGNVGKGNKLNITGNNINLLFISNILSSKLPVTGTMNFHSRIIGKGVSIKGKVKKFMYKKLTGDSLIFAGNIFPDKIMLDKVELYDKGKMEIEGIIPVKNGKLSHSGNIQIGLNLKNTSGWIFLPFSKYIKFNTGNLTGNVEVKGKVNNPFLSGFIMLNNTSVTVLSTSTDIEQIEGVIGIDNKEIKVHHLTGKVESGKIEISGNAHLMPIPSYNFTLQMKKVPFKGLKDVKTVLDGKINFYSKEKIPSIKGKLDIIKAEITIPFKKTERITTYKKEYYVDLHLDATKYNIWLKNNLTNAEIGGDIRIVYNKKWNISGLLRTKQGKLFYLDREFSLLKGKFHFLNTQEINPEIQFLAATFIPPNDSIFLSVSGSMLKPKFSLYSKPPMSLDEIIAVLNLNMEWSQLASLGEIESEVRKRVITYWVRKTLLKEIQSRVGLDMMSLKGGERTELIIGKYFTRNFYVTYSTNVFSYEYSKLHLEYRFGKWGNFIGEQDATGKSRFIMQMKFRY